LKTTLGVGASKQISKLSERVSESKRLFVAAEDATKARQKLKPGKQRIIMGQVQLQHKFPRQIQMQ